PQRFCSAPNVSCRQDPSAGERLATRIEICDPGYIKLATICFPICGLNARPAYFRQKSPKPQNRENFMRQMLPWSAPVQTRRRFLANGLVGLGTGAAILSSSLCRAAETATLSKLAAEAGLLYGTTIAAAQITGDRPF